MAGKRFFLLLSSLVQRWATVVGDSVRIEVIQLCHSAAVVSVRRGTIGLSVVAVSFFLWNDSGEGTAVGSSAAATRHVCAICGRHQRENR